MFKIGNLLQTRTYDKGIKYIDANIQNLFGINWFEAMDIKFKFAINTNNIYLSNQILKEVLKNKLQSVVQKFCTTNN